MSLLCHVADCAILVVSLPSKFNTISDTFKAAFDGKQDELVKKINDHQLADEHSLLHVCRQAHKVITRHKKTLISETSRFRRSDDLRKFALQCNAKCPSRFTSTNVHNCSATTSQPEATRNGNYWQEVKHWFIIEETR